jgi:hypothetical protein
MVIGLVTELGTGTVIELVTELRNGKNWGLD